MVASGADPAAAAIPDGVNSTASGRKENIEELMIAK